MGPTAPALVVLVSVLLDTEWEDLVLDMVVLVVTALDTVFLLVDTVELVDIVGLVDTVELAEATGE